MAKLVFIDIKTTGMNPRENAIYQISGAIVSEDDIHPKTQQKGVIKKFFNYYLKPFPGAKINKETLDKQGITEADIEEYAPMVDTYNKFKSILEVFTDRYNKMDKYTVIGYQIDLKEAFLRQLFSKFVDDQRAAAESREMKRRENLSLQAKKARQEIKALKQVQRDQKAVNELRSLKQSMKPKSQSIFGDMNQQKKKKGKDDFFGF